MSELNVQPGLDLERLLKEDEDKLYLELGSRLQALTADVTSSSEFKLFAHEEDLEGLKDKLKEFGERYFKTQEKELHSLFCSSSQKYDDARDMFYKAFDLGKKSFSEVLVIILVKYLGLASTIATIVAALFMLLIFRPLYKQCCDDWSKRLSKTN